MVRLHAYWRYEYIKHHEHDNKNIFTDLPKKTDEESLILHRTKHCYLVMNEFPYNAGHLLAIPYKEVPALNELIIEERLDLINLIAFGEELLKKALSPDALNIGINLGKASGGSIVNHLHVHIVPRWTGDTNFMPVINETRILPVALKEMWKHLMKFV